MTEPELVGIDLWSPERDLFAAIRGDAALVVTSGTVTGARGRAVEMGDAGARVEAEGVSFEVKLSAIAEGTASAAGPQRSVQLCEIDGTVAADGRPKSLHGLGMRTRAAAEPVDAQRLRFVSAATPEGSLVSVVAMRPDAGTPHGDELVAGCEILAQSENGPRLFEEVRLSTIYGADGLPRKAGAELYRPGEELPARLSGEAISGAPLELDGKTLAISFFRWTLMGRPAWGTYEMESTA